MKAHLIILLVVTTFSSHSQSPQPSELIVHKLVNLGIVPGVETNGLNGRNTINSYNLNIFTSYTYGNHILEISSLSNYKSDQVSGIQLTGLFNVIDHEKKDPKERASNLNAVQVAGLCNLVKGGGLGYQASGLLNIVQEDLKGSQASGLLNYTGKTLEGIQLSFSGNSTAGMAFGLQAAGLFNYARGMSGIQLGGLFNFTRSDLDGIQIGAFNLINCRYGNLTPNRRIYWIQVGLVNRTIRNSNGAQIGLINIGNEVGKTQVGLINISDKIPEYPVGLLNVGSNTEGYLRLYYSLNYPVNVQLCTGSEKLMNSIVYKHNLNFDSPVWAIGYALGKTKRSGHFKNQHMMVYELLTLHEVTENNRFLQPNISLGPQLFYAYNLFYAVKTFDLYLGIGGNVLTNLTRTYINNGEGSPIDFTVSNRKFTADLNIGLHAWL